MTPAPRRGLGRGLDALLASSDPDRATEGTAGSGLIEIDPGTVAPNSEQPRQQFTTTALTTLAESIRLHGLLHPIVVERDGDSYRLVAGERRLRAAREAGVASIPAIVRPSTETVREKLELALIENLHREQLNAMEEATAYQRLADVFGLSHDAIALRLGRSRPAVTNTIRLLNLPAPLQEAVAEGRLSAAHGRALLALDDGDAQMRVATRIEAEGLSVRATEQAVQKELESGAHRPPAGSATAAGLSPDDEAVRRGLEEALGLPVRLERRRKGGRVVIEFSGDEDLGGLYDRVGGRPL